MKFDLNPLNKLKLKLWLARRLNFRYCHYHGYRFFWDRVCYPELESVARPVIFDVGANVGQTAAGFREHFPGAEIHCFEPVPASFRALQSHTAGMDIRCHQLAMSDTPGRVKVRLLSEAPWSLLGLSMAGWNALISLGLAGLAFAAVWPKPAATPQAEAA